MSITPIPHMDFFYNNFNNLEDTTSSGKKKEKEDGQSDKRGLFCHSVLLGALVCSLQLAFCNGAHANIWIGSDTGSDYDSSNNPVPEGTAYDEIYGGKIDKSSSTEAAKAKNNILRLNSNHLLNTKGKIYGGYARSEKEAEASSNNVEFSNVKFENVAEICGGYAGNTVSSTSFTVTVQGVALPVVFLVAPKGKHCYRNYLWKRHAEPHLPLSHPRG